MLQCMNWVFLFFTKDMPEYILSFISERNNIACINAIYFRLTEDNRINFRNPEGTDLVRLCVPFPWILDNDLLVINTGSEMSDSSFTY